MEPQKFSRWNYISPLSPSGVKIDGIREERIEFFVDSILRIRSLENGGGRNKEIFGSYHLSTLKAQNLAVEVGPLG